MWTKTLLVLGTVVVGLGAFYVVYSGDEASVRGPETTSSSDRTTEDFLSLGGTTNDAARIDGDADENVLAAERMGIGAEELVRVLERLFASGSDDGQGADAHAPYTSKDIALDNGAHYFLLAVELFPDVDMQKLRAKWEELRANGFPDDAEFWAMLDKFQEAFDAIRTGLEVGNALMPPVRTPGGMHLARFRKLAQVMNMEAQYYAAQGHYGAGFDDYITVLNFASESSRGGVVIDGLLAIAMEQMAAKSLRETLAWGGAAPEDYRFLIDQMEALDAQMNTAWEILETEAGLVNSWLDVLLESGLDLRAAFEEEAPEFGDVLATMTDDELESMYRESFQDYDGLVEYLALPYYEAQAVDLDALLSQNPIGHLLVEAMGKILVQEAATRAEIRGTMLSVALELYALENDAYPDSLEALMPGYLALLPEDPFSGGSFGYAASGSGYVLWSAGPDMRDDGGVPLDGTGSFDEREGDIVIQGEEADAVG